MPQPRASVPIAVVVALTLVGGTAVAEFAGVEGRLTSTWAAIRGGDASVVDPESYEWGRYALFLTLAEQGNGAEIVLPEQFGGNLRGRLLGLAQLSSWRVVPFDEQAVVEAALASDGERFTGPVSDGDATFTIVRLDADVSTLVFARVGNGDIVVVDVRLLPAELTEGLAP